MGEFWIKLTTERVSASCKWILYRKHGAAHFSDQSYRRSYDTESRDASCSLAWRFFAFPTLNRFNDASSFPGSVASLHSFTASPAATEDTSARLRGDSAKPFVFECLCYLSQSGWKARAFSKTQEGALKYSDRDKVYLVIFSIRNIR